MERKRVFTPGEMVSTFTGQVGMVISEDVYSKIRLCLKEAKRPGHYFAPGCCHHPDYIIQVPVVFEDGVYDVMRAMNIKRTQAVPAEKKEHIQSIIDGFVKSRHPGENRGPDKLQAFDITGFRLPPE